MRGARAVREGTGQGAPGAGRRLPEPGPGHTPRGAGQGTGAMGRGGLWRRGKRDREATEREFSLGDFHSACLHPEGPFRELRGRWAGPGRGKCPGVPGAAASALPAARPPQGRQKPSSLPTYRSTFLIPWDVILPPYKRLLNHFVPVNNEYWELLLFVKK